MIHDGTVSAISIAIPDVVEQFCMRLQTPFYRTWHIIRFSNDPTNLINEGFQQNTQKRVMRCAGNCQVKFKISLCPFADVAAVFLHTLKAVSQPRKIFIRAALSRQANVLPFQNAARLIKGGYRLTGADETDVTAKRVAGCFGAGLAHVGPTAVKDIDKTPFLQEFKGFAHDIAADTELSSKLLFRRKLAARHKRSIENGIFNSGRNNFWQAFSFNLAKCIHVSLTNPTSQQ